MLVEERREGLGGRFRGPGRGVVGRGAVGAVAPVGKHGCVPPADAVPDPLEGVVALVKPLGNVAEEPVRGDGNGDNFTVADRDAEQVGKPYVVVEFDECHVAGGDPPPQLPPVKLSDVNSAAAAASGDRRSARLAGERRPEPVKLVLRQRRVPAAPLPDSGLDPVDHVVGGVPGVGGTQTVTYAVRRVARLRRPPLLPGVEFVDIGGFLTGERGEPLDVVRAPGHGVTPNRSSACGVDPGPYPSTNRNARRLYARRSASTSSTSARRLWYGERS